MDCRIALDHGRDARDPGSGTHRQVCLRLPVIALGHWARASIRPRRSAGMDDSGQALHRVEPRPSAVASGGGAVQATQRKSTCPAEPPPRNSAVDATNDEAVPKAARLSGTEGLEKPAVRSRSSSSGLRITNWAPSRLSCSRGSRTGEVPVGSYRVDQQRDAVLGHLRGVVADHPVKRSRTGSRSTRRPARTRAASDRLFPTSLQNLWWRRSVKISGNRRGVVQRHFRRPRSAAWPLCTAVIIVDRRDRPAPVSGFSRSRLMLYRWSAHCRGSNVVPESAMKPPARRTEGC